MRVFKTTRTAAAFTALALLTAACGGGDGDGTATDEDTSTEDMTDEETSEDMTEEDMTDEEMASEEMTDEAMAGDYSLISDGALTICTDSPYPPFEFEDADSPSGFSGFDIDLVQAMADAEGLSLTVVVTGFDAIQSGTALAAGTCDMAASAMTITEEREGNLDFLDPYFDADQSLLSTADGPQSLDEVTALGVQADTTGAAYAAENYAGEATEFPDAAALSTALQAGNIDAILQDLPVNADIATSNDAYTIVDTFPTGEQYGFAVAEGNTALRDAFNSVLADLRADGTYDAIYAEYFDV